MLLLAQLENSLYKFGILPMVVDSCCERRDEEKEKETKMDMGHAWAVRGGRWIFNGAIYLPTVEYEMVHQL